MKKTPPLFGKTCQVEIFKFLKTKATLNLRKIGILPTHPMNLTRFVITIPPEIGQKIIKFSKKKSVIMKNRHGIGRNHI